VHGAAGLKLGIIMKFSLAWDIKGAGAGTRSSMVRDTRTSAYLIARDASTLSISVGKF